MGDGRAGNSSSKPEWLEQYDVIGKIGEGTYGLVFLAKIKANRSKSIAIKKFKQSKDGDGVSPTAIREIMMDLISLEDAAKLLLGDGKHTSMTTRTKVRRLYDIANLLSSMKFIEKIHHPETRKPAFRWLGLNGKPDNGIVDSKKRIFGIDLTNTIKRFKVDEDGLQILKPVNLMRVKNETENEDDRTTTMGAKSYQFGPFAPANVPQVGVSNDYKGKQVVDWESLASTYRPKYHNQG